LNLKTSVFNVNDHCLLKAEQTSVTVNS